jgi:hypothetical protein
VEYVTAADESDGPQLASLLRMVDGWAVSAPRDARFAFAGEPHLYKIQVAGPLLSSGDDKTSDPCMTFLKEVLPAVRPYLVKSVKE